jgi:hypothetical protein
VKLAFKFISKMVENIEDNSIPKEIPAFVRSLFVKLPKEGFAHVSC